MQTTCSSPAPAIFQQLKASTAHIHAQVERKLQIFSPRFDVPAYVRLLTRFYGFWAPIEAKLWQFPELREPALELGSRFKAHLLEADLRTFGIDPTGVPFCSALPRLQTPFHGLGCLYVLEGSTLGARFIAKHISARFEIGESSGGSFFNAYGAAVGERWSAFRAYVTSQAETGSADEILSGACDTFAALDEWLDPM